MKKFQKITSEHLGIPFGAGYGDQGEIFVGGICGRRRDPQCRRKSPCISEVAPLQKLLSGGKKSPEAASGKNGACFLDFDGDGRADLFLVGAGNGKSTLLRNVSGGGRFEDVTEKSWARRSRRRLWLRGGRDFDNDGKTDLAVCEAGGVRLFHNEGGGKFVDVNGEGRNPARRQLCFADLCGLRP